MPCSLCEESGKELIILDRFNPLGGKVEGNVLQNGYESFIGAYPVCMRYGIDCRGTGRNHLPGAGLSFPNFCSKGRRVES